MDDLTKALAYEIKQDIANRYFGFRKRIETETNQYLQDIESVDEEYLAGIKTDLQRMHCLLRKDELFRSFLSFTKLPDSLADDTCGHEPSQWQRLFANLKGEGFTRKRRYRNLVHKIYNSLAAHIDAYRDVFIDLTEEHEEICTDIDQFSRKNDLSGILNFLREIDNPDSLHSGILQADRASLNGRSMDQELRIIPPPPVTSRMHSLEQLPPLSVAKPTLDSFIKQAFPLYDRIDAIKLPF